MAIVEQSIIVYFDEVVGMVGREITGGVDDDDESWALFSIMYIKFLSALLLLSLQGTEVASQNLSTYKITFDAVSVQMCMGNSTTVEVKITPAVLPQKGSAGNFSVLFYSTDLYVATASSEIFNTSDVEFLDGTYKLAVNITADLIGRTKICAQGQDPNNYTIVESCLNVSVIRVTRTIDKVFLYSVIGLVSIMFTHVGAVLDRKTMMENLKRPMGPILGLVAQFVIMPLLSFGIAKLVLPVPILQLGLFITGCSPGGGASNMWTVTLGGNMDLSITMTTLSTFLSFLFMPFWIFTLGSTIFSEANLQIPYGRLGLFAGCLVVPLCLGMLLQSKFPTINKQLFRFLKPFSVFLIVFIIIFAVITNFYLFQLFTWQIVLAGILLPWLGCILGGGVAFLLKQTWKDVLTIAIETGVQNTGLAICFLSLSLPQPDSDTTTVIPVAVAMMTPVLPTLLLLAQKIIVFTKPLLAKKEETPTAVVGIENGMEMDVY